MNLPKFSNLIALPLLLSVLVVPPGALADEGSAEHELHELLDAFLAGASVNDVEMHDRFWAENLVYTSSAGKRRGKAEIIASLRAEAEAGNDPEGLPEYRGEDVSIRVFGEFAVITFRLVAEMPDGGVSEYFNTGVFALRDGLWKAFTWQATRIPDAGGSD